MTHRQAQSPRKTLTALIPLSLALSASGGGCNVHVSGHTEPVESPKAFGQDGSAMVPERWWRAFDDAALNRLQRRALEGNFDLAVARDRLRAARAVVDRESAALFPALDFSLTAEQSRRESEDFDATEQFGGDLSATYELDLWNRIESEVEQAKFEQAVTREQLKAAAITLSADIASTWYALVQQRGQRRILEEQIETNEQVLEVVRKRFGRGLVRASDVLRQQRLLESTREQRAAVQSQIETLEHQLLVLIGRPPTEDVQAEQAELPETPAKPRLGLPSELVRRRPDVRSAFYAVKAADRGIAAAIADRYPSVTLGASASVASPDVVSLFDDWVQTLTADVLGPVFDAGRRKAEVRRTRAVKQQRLDEYGQVILTAFRQVTDALSRERSQQEQIRRIRRQLDLAQRTSERLRREYLNGDISYIDVLDALTREQQLQRDLLQARFQRIDDRIALYQALAGGWESIVPPDDDQGEQYTVDDQRAMP